MRERVPVKGEEGKKCQLGRKRERKGEVKGKRGKGCQIKVKWEKGKGREGERGRSEGRKGSQ